MKSIKGEKIVVIGGTGWLGHNSVRQAAKKGALVTVLARHTQPDEGNISYVIGSITNIESLKPALQNAMGIVISVESSRDPEQLNEVYVEGVKNVLKVAPRNAHIIFMGHIGITEIERMPDYNKAKLKAEELIRQSGFLYTIIRPAWVIGDEENGEGISLEQGDQYTGRRNDISGVTLGKVIVAALENPQSLGKTFELYSGDNQIDNWSEAFEKLKADV